MKRIEVEDLPVFAEAVWVGAASFEPRCTGSLEVLASQKVRMRKGIVIQYRTGIRQARTGKSQRHENLRRIRRLGKEVFAEGTEERELDAYVFEDLLRLGRDLLSEGVRLVVLDATCLTKIHGLAAASFFATLGRKCRLIVAYSVPENYGFVDSTLNIEPGWRDLIIAPLAETAQMFNESSGKGVVIPGHESHRLIVSIGEIEPAGGVILLSSLASRPDLRHLMLRRNQRLLQQLTRLASRRWQKADVDISTLSGLQKRIKVLVGEAEAENAPVILFPFGPKPVIFATALQLTSSYPESSWFVYPIPVEYDASYSFGLERVLWFRAQ